MRILILGTDGVADWKQYIGIHDFAYFNAFSETISIEYMWIEQKCKVYTTFEEAVEDYNPDIAVIGVPNYRKNNPYYETFLLQKGIDIYSHKLRIKNYDDFITIYNAAKASHANFFCGEFYRFNPLVQTVKNILKSGDIGHPDMVMWECYLSSSEVWEWEKSYESLAIQDLALHHFSAIQYLVGLDISSVYSKILTPEKGLPSKGTVAMSILYTKDNCTINHIIDWHNCHKETSFLGNFSIYGEYGVVSVDDTMVYLKKWTEESIEIPVVQQVKSPVEQVMQYYNSYTSKPYTISEFSQVMNVVENCILSDKNNQVVLF